jgi:hypothetical protein
LVTVTPGHQLGIRATSPARTLLDCARELSSARLTRILADGRRAGLLHLEQLRDVIARNPNHPGATLLRPLIDAVGAPTRSHFEDTFPDYCVRHGLPRPIINAQVNGYEVDAHFPEQGVIVELDGWEFHRDRHAFGADRERDAHALRTVRLTWERYTTAPESEARRLHAILARGPASSR